MSIKIKIKILNQSRTIILPNYATLCSAGMDLCADITEPVIIKPAEVRLIATGMAIALPIGFEAQVRPRSGIALKYGVTVLNSPGTIDADYRGEVKVMLINHGKQDFVVEVDMRIAQLVVAKHERVIWETVEELEETSRGSGGFGSTGLT
ncbi:dUTP diphosphatase [Candidatus Trichorickettsia mobilis]|uniref:dUTP diphosphatase n=1 Tax=Candidatus Trichorickettsia mobilis TaxID=1346319 RepID=UPI00292D0113|nr:dUTP diphosphatase [Candidatus Trichorickettsia mobilis]